jgi:hypothetical protein
VHDVAAMRDALAVATAVTAHRISSGFRWQDGVDIFLLTIGIYSGIN